MAVKTKARPKASRKPASKTGGLHLKKIERVIVFVKDFERMVDFYNKTLCISLRSKEQGWAEFNTQGITLCLHQGRESTPVTAEPQIGFRVDDLDATCEALRARGIVFAPVSSPCPGTRMTHFRDPEGNYVGIEGR